MTFQAYVAKDRRFAGMTFDFLIASPIAEEWYSGDDQVLPERKWCTDRIKPGDVILDCGAHHGMTTVLFAKHTGPTGSVISFEPVLASADVIRRNATLNGLENIEVRAVGLSDKRKTAYVTIGENVALSDVDALPFYRKFNNPWSNKERLDIRTIDDEIPAGARVDMIKLDVEGVELAALQGARRVLQSRPALCIEIHNFIHNGADVAGIAEILRPLRYRYYLNGSLFDPVEGPTGAIDIERVCSFPNPHVYCEPLD